MNCIMPGLPVHHQLPEFTQTHVHWVGDAIHPSHPLSSPFPPAPNPSQHQSLFQWVNSLHEVAKVWGFWQPKTHKTQTLVSNQLWRKKLSNPSAEPSHSEPRKVPRSRVRWQEFPAITKKSPSTFYIVPREKNKWFKFCHREKPQKSTLPVALGCGAAWAAGISWWLGWCCNNSLALPPCTLPAPSPHPPNCHTGHLTQAVCSHSKQKVLNQEPPPGCTSGSSAKILWMTPEAFQVWLPRLILSSFNGLQSGQAKPSQE